MKIEIIKHLLYIDGKQVEFKKTPNISAYKNKLQYLVLHYTATASFSSPYSWLTNKDSNVSAHLVIGRDGRVVQLAPFDAVCWHAGKSEWKGIIGLNSYSIGIEMVNAGILGKKGDKYVSADGVIVEDYIKAKNQHGVSATWQTYTDVQVQVTSAISQALKNYYGLKEIIGHEDISPIRKTDPGPAFPWSKIRIPEGFTTKLTTALVNIRSGAGTNFEKLKDPIPANTQVKVLKTQGEWDYVEVHGINGWIYNKYLK